MSDLPSVSGKDAVKAFCRSGYELAREGKKHTILKADGRPTLSVPRHKELKRGLLGGLIADADLTTEQFKDYL